MQNSRHDLAPIAITPSMLAALLLISASALATERRGDAWRVLQREHAELSAQIAPAWRDALARMSATQLDALRHGASLDSIVLDGSGLDGGETLLRYMSKRRLVDLPDALLAEPVGGGTSRGGSFLLDAQVLPKGSPVPNGSLTGGGFRLDPLLAGGGGTSTSAQFQLTASIGQPTVATSHSAQTTLKAGFWTPTDAVAVTVIFRDGFE